MRRDKSSLEYLLLYGFGAAAVIWIGLLIAPVVNGGLIGIIRNFGKIMDEPFKVRICEDSFKTVLILLVCYGLGIGVFISSERNYRRREEHGSARWGDARVINKKYADRDMSNNKILTQHVSIGLDGRKHRRNLNVLVCGGSGAGKTRFYAKPNILNANSSYVILDPKGTQYEILNAERHV